MCLSICFATNFLLYFIFHLHVFQDNESDIDTEIPVRKKPGPKPKNTQIVTAPRGRPPKDGIPLKKRLHNLAKYLLDFTVCTITYI